MVVSPDGTESESPRPGPGRTALFIAAVLIVAIGFGALGALSTGNEVAAPETTTSTTIGDVLPPIDPENFSVSQLVTGTQPDWTLSGEFDCSLPVGLTEHNGAFYLFTTDAPPWPLIDTGLAAWRSQDGQEWTSLGRVIGDEYLVSTVVSTPLGLVAAGRPEDGSGLTIWRSDDGTRWTAADIPIATANPHLVSYPTAIGSMDDGLIVAAVTTLDTPKLIRDRLRDIGIELDLTEFSWQVQWLGEDGHVLSVHGPFGIEVLEIALDDLDLSSDEREWIANGFSRTPATPVWLQRNGSEWQESEIEGVFTVDQIVGRPDGSLLAFGFGPVGPLIRQSQDGLDWTSIDEDSVPNSVRQWNERLVGLDEMSRPEALVSDDGRVWEQLGLAERFPHFLSWGPTAMDAGTDGMGIAIEGWANASPPEGTDPITLTVSNGSKLFFDSEEQAFVHETADRSYTWGLSAVTGSREGPEGIEVDPGQGTVTFLDPETDEPLVQVTFAELALAETEYFSGGTGTGDHRAFAFTSDGTVWIIQDLSAEMGTEGRIGMLEIGAGKILALVQEPPTYLMLGGQSLVPGATGFEMWTAEIP